MRFLDKARIQQQTKNVLVWIAHTNAVKSCLATQDRNAVDAVRLATAFQEDTYTLLSNPLLPAHVILAHDTNSLDLPASVQTLPYISFKADPEKGELARLINSQLARSEIAAVCILGSQTPHLPFAFLVEAFARLASPHVDMVVGPTDRGSCYLFGTTRPLPESFLDSMGNNSDGVTQIRDSAAMVSWNLATLPTWYALESPADVTKLRQDISRKIVTVRGTANVLGV